MGEGGDGAGGNPREAGGNLREAAGELRRLLPLAWYAFLARFGTPRPIQIAAIPVILQGRDALLLAPTAGGKTEAWAAPLCELAMDRGPREPPPGPVICVVCPTRALVNDLARRLEGPVGALGLTVGRRTGEHRELGNGRAPDVVITTPESVDSMLARTPGVLAGLAHLVLDEVHLLSSSARGDQLACLVTRLRRLCPNLRVVASSATVDYPERLAARYLDPDHRVVAVAGERAILARIQPGGVSALQDALSRLARREVHKVLAFVARRADAERMAGLLAGRPPFGDAVYVHHGSLSKGRREWVERSMLKVDTGLCFATPTLEVGIDIGDIDLVVLTTPPPDVASFLQRLGRGCRRTEASRVLCLAADAGEALRFEHLLEAARQGRLLSEPRFFSPGVLVQQCFGLLHQGRAGWISASVLSGRLPPELAEGPMVAELPALLAHLAKERWLAGGPERYRAGERLEAAWGRGRVHGNIEEEPGQVSLVDRDTRQVVGTVPRRAARQGRLRLGGRRLRVTGAGGADRLLVADTRGSAQLAPGGRAGWILPGPLARDLARFVGIPEGVAPALLLPSGDFAVLHFQGSLFAMALSALHAARKTPGLLGADGLVAVVQGEPEALFPALEPEELKAALRARAVRLARRLPGSPWDRELPRAMREAHLLRCFDSDRITQTLGSLRVARESASGKPVVPPHRRDALVALATRLLG